MKLIRILSGSLSLALTLGACGDAGTNFFSNPSGGATGSGGASQSTGGAGSSASGAAGSAAAGAPMSGSSGGSDSGATMGEGGVSEGGSEADGPGEAGSGAAADAGRTGSGGSAAGGKSGSSGGASTTGGSRSSGGQSTTGGTASTGGASTTSGGAQATGGATASGGAGGAPDMECTMLANELRTLLEKAQACDRSVNATQCRGFVDVQCGCAVPVNDPGSPETHAYEQALQRLQKRCPIACADIIEPICEGQAAICNAERGARAGRCIVRAADRDGPSMF